MRKQSWVYTFKCQQFSIRRRLQYYNLDVINIKWIIENCVFFNENRVESWHLIYYTKELIGTIALVYIMESSHGNIRNMNDF